MPYVIQQPLTAREADVLAAIRRYSAIAPGVVPVARVLNFGKPCDWCPVEKPAEGKRVARVPRRSRERVARVLRRLAAKGLLVNVFARTRHSGYVPREIVGDGTGWGL